MASEANGRTLFVENTKPSQPLSRYNKIRMLLREDGIPVQETFDRPDIVTSSADRFFEVTQPFVNRPDLVSRLYYGTEQLYWVIALANDMIDPFIETTVGKQLRIPDRDTLFTTVLAR